MTKAEEAALKAYPTNWARALLPNGSTIDFDANETTRYVFKRGYRQGYEQAKKDFALTPEDIGLIFNKVRELQIKYNSTEGCYQEVADWFNGLKDE